MGIFDFVKNAGRRAILGPEAAARAAKPTPPSEESLKQAIDNLNLGVSNVRVHLEDDKAIIEGEAPSQEAVEKTILAVGNTQGIAKVESRLRTPAAQTSPRFYTVKSGDTLSSIAQIQLGDAKRYPEIFEANRPLLKDPDEIYPGQNLRIPA